MIYKRLANPLLYYMITAHYNTNIY